MPVGSLLLSRRSLVLSASYAVLAGPSLAQRPPVVTPSVLFICRYGTVKSPIGREVLRRRASEQGVAVAPYSRGLTIEDHITPRLAQALRADKIDIWSEPRRVLDPSDIARADVVVAFDNLPADLPPPTHDWSDFPSFNEDYATARSELDVRLARLLDDLRRWRPISAAAVS